VERTMATLSSHKYGKSRVKVLKVVRKTGGVHVVFDYNVQVLLEGAAFVETYITGDNASVVATDTIKNTVYILAHQNSFESPEEFGIIIGAHFLKEYSWVEKVGVDIVQNQWQRISVDGKDNQHSFTKISPEIRTAHVSSPRKGTVFVESGIKDLLVMKTTASGFEGFHKDKYTTLEETKDRVFATSVTCTWKYNTLSADYNASWNGVKHSILKIFAGTYSASVQQTLHQIAQDALQHHAAIEDVHLSLPNKHAFVFNLARFGIPVNNTVFQPIEDPSGLIEGTVRRNRAKL